MFERIDQSSSDITHLPTAQESLLGLQAKNALPTVLQPQRINAYRNEFYREYNPVGFTERTIVNDLARRAANMELLESVTAALQRQGAGALLDVTLPLSGEIGGTCEDAVLAAAIASGRIDECQRQSLGNSRAFYHALDVLRKLQTDRRRYSTVDLYRPDQRFMTEADCTFYLLHRFEGGEQTCRRCGSANGCWIASRRCWECGSCKAQVGLRVGTVMERSALPLVQWFAAIRIVFLAPSITTSELSEMVGIKRGATVRSMSEKIRAAMASEDASKLLAELDGIYTPTT